jgi:sugar phosphate isomerase/epimerase
MKTSIVILDLDVAKPSEFERKIDKAYKLGYNGIELNVRDPNQIDVASIKRIISSRNIDVSGIITGKAFAVDGLSLSHFDERNRRLAVRRIMDHISLASSLSSVTLIGYVRGTWSPDPQKARRLFMNSLATCAKFAEDRGVLLVIEPINRYEVDSIHTIDEAVAISKEIGAPNVRIVADTFHMNIEETESIDRSIRRCQGILSHVHVADNNRRPPGMGHLPFREFFEALREIGYHDFVSVEVIPMIPDFDTVAEKSIRFLKNNLNP